jgi:hypothetical protein
MVSCFCFIWFGRSVRQGGPGHRGDQGNGGGECAPFTAEYTYPYPWRQCGHRLQRGRAWQMLRCYAALRSALALPPPPTHSASPPSLSLSHLPNKQLLRSFNFYPTEEELKKAIAEVDADGSGEVSFKAPRWHVGGKKKSTQPATLKLRRAVARSAKRETRSSSPHPQCDHP